MQVRKHRPQVVARQSAQCGTLTVIDSGGDGGENGVNGDPPLGGVNANLLIPAAIVLGVAVWSYSGGE